MTQAVRRATLTLFTAAAAGALACSGAASPDLAPASAMATPGVAASAPVVEDPAVATVAPPSSTGATASAPSATVPPASQPATTSVAAPTKFRFLAWGDTKVDTGTSAGQVLASLSADAKGLDPAPSFTLYLGDLEETGFSAAAGLADDWLAHLDGSTSNGTSRITFVTRGNHDAIDAASTASWQSYFDFAKVARAAGASAFTELDPGLTYSFDYGNAHFVSLDAPGDFPTTVSQRALAWLDQDLAGAEARGLTHAFLFWHGPLYTVSTSIHAMDSGNPAPAIQQVVAIAGRHPIVSALLNGHEHLLAYEHIGPAAFPTLSVAHEFEQFTIGSGGAAYHDPMPGRGDAVLPYVPGYATVDVDGRSFTVTWRTPGSAVPQGTFSFTK